MQEQGRPVIGVVGGSGGVGTSSFAAALAVGADAATLIDVDVDGGGLDVVLGLESVPGARWSGLRLAGGALDPGVLADGLVPWGACRVLAADVTSLDPAAVTQVIDTASQVGAVVLDLPRRDCPERAAAVERCDVVVILARGDVPGLVAAHAVASGLAGAPALGLLVRDRARGARDGAAGIGTRAAARLVGVELVGSLPALRGRAFDPLYPSSRVARIVGGLLSGVADSGAPIAPMRLETRLAAAGVIA